MRFTSTLLCVWPGLPRLWLRGSWSALAIATAFGVALNLLLVSSFLGAFWLPLPLRIGGWLVLLGTWLTFVVRGYGEIFQFGASKQVNDRGLFIRAQGEYLRGHWFEAESLLQQLLQLSQHDVEAQLLLATVYRRSQRWDEARTRLGLLADCDGADKWRWEVEAERRLLQRLSGTKPSSTNPSSTKQPSDH